MEKIETATEAKRPKFQLSLLKPSCKNKPGMMYLFMVKVDEKVAVMADEKSVSGHGVCWIKYHQLKGLVIRIEGGQHVDLPAFFSKLPYFETHIFEADDPYTNLVEDFEYMWMCRTIRCTDGGHEQKIKCGCNIDGSYIDYFGIVSEYLDIFRAARTRV